MRVVMGIAGLLVVLAIAGVVAKKQLAAVQAPTATATGNVRQQSQQVQRQVRQQVEGLMQQARPMPDDESK